MKLNNGLKEYWDGVFTEKDTSKVSWFQSIPLQSLELIKKYSNPDQSVIDVGGGDSRFADELLNLNYNQISILDISEIALQKSQERLQERAKRVNWLTSNVLELNTGKKFHVWHDRAVLHFLIRTQDILNYKSKVQEHLVENGIVVLGTFAKDVGPTRCSGLNVRGHDYQSIKDFFTPEFKVLESFRESHVTPSSGVQEFNWTVLKNNI